MPRWRPSALLLAAIAVAGPSARAFESGSIDSGGLARSYAIEVPERSGSVERMPLVIVLHGAGGQGTTAMRSYRWDATAKRGGFIAVAPDAAPAFLDRPADFRTNPRYWNDGSGRGPAGHLRVDDVAFLAQLIDVLAARYPIDRGRVYATGFSSGASMTHRLGIELSDRLAAIAPVAGKAWVLTSPKRTLPVLFLVGESDPLTPLNGGPVKLPWGGEQTYPPARELPEAWASLDHCQAPSAIEQPLAQMTLRAWRVCADGAEVLFYTVAGLGHEWAGGAGRLLPEAMTGPYSDAVDTTELIWKFFRRHRRK